MTPLDEARATAAFAPIALAELVGLAALQTRVDRKYVVPVSDLPLLLALLPASARVLDIDGRRTFSYRSVYVDTPDLRCFRHAGQGRRRRFKIRSRSYLDTGTTWLEVKTRAGRSTTVKDRIEHPDLEHAPLTAEGGDFVRETLQQRGFRADDTVLSPALVTTYRRTTLHLEGTGGRETSRGTIDTDLAFSSPGPHVGSERRDGLSAPGLAVVETKGGSSPSVLDRQLWRLGHRPVALSKYGTGLSALHPELPDLKWHRTLHRHLAVPTTPSPAPTKDLT